MALPTPLPTPPLALRPIRPGDKAALAAGLTRLSRDSAYQRFLSPKPRFSASELRYLSEVDFVDHYALVATPVDAPGHVLAVGRWVRHADRPDSAEIAIVVADHLQGRGVGTRVGEALAAAARERGITRFTATMLPENRAARRLLARLTSSLHVRHDHGVDELAAVLLAA
ncbi:MAG TPA: GNAT family N-acetyltransferase [Baekduia sp.]|nr:GNAT family N-acetyltransferase [Baekduia sp.]